MQFYFVPAFLLFVTGALAQSTSTSYLTSTVVTTISPSVTTETTSVVVTRATTQVTTDTFVISTTRTASQNAAPTEGSHMGAMLGAAGAAGVVAIGLL